MKRLLPWSLRRTTTSPGWRTWNLRLTQEGAQLDPVHLGEQRHAGTNALQDIVGGPGQAREDGAQLRLVRGLHGMAHEVFDHLVALVETVLDQRVAGDGADQVEAANVRLVGRRQLRNGRRIVRRQVDTDRAQERRRRARTEPADDPIGLEADLACVRPEHDCPLFEAFSPSSSDSV